MRHPTVDEAKRLAKYLQCDAVLIVAIHEGKGQACGASWGRDRETCTVAGKYLDDSIDRILRTWPDADTLQQPLQQGLQQPLWRHNPHILECARCRGERGRRDCPICRGFGLCWKDDDKTTARKGEEVP